MRFVSRSLLMVLAVFAMLAVPMAVQAAERVARVSGGGRADFLATPNAVNTTGFTNFAVGVSVFDDGSAQGHFQCVIPSIVAISGDVLGGKVNEDGSVTVYGLAHGYDSFIPGPFFDLPFMVTFYAGGPGVGGFDYRDESGIFGDGQFDSELIRRGRIGITIDP